jgi:crossover junction endonuclease EME1
MPEVIDLIDSTPPPSPPPSTQPRPLAVRRSPSKPLPSSPNFLSDEFDPSSSLFVYDELERSVKKRKVTPELPPVEDKLSPLPRVDQFAAKDESFFTFSDDFVDPPTLPPSSRGVAAVSRSTTITSTKTTTATMKTYTWEGEESDPIVFTSSAPERTTTKERQQSRLGHKNSAAITIDDDDDIQDFSDPFTSRDDILDKLLDEPQPTLKRGLSDRTASLLASLNDTTSKTSGGPVRAGKRSNNFEFDDSLPNILEQPKKAPQPKAKPKLSSEEKTAKAKDREVARTQREREKETEKEKKRVQKEERAKEKQLAADIAEVNKSKTHKKESMPEMIVDMSQSFEETSIGNQVVEYVKQLGASHTFFESRIPNVVKWRRKKKAQYLEDAGRWEPCPLRIVPENYVLIMTTAQEFVDMIVDPSGDTPGNSQTLEQNVLKLKHAYPGCNTIYLIENLSGWMRKNSNSRNRAYQAAVLRQMNDTNQLDNPPQGTENSQANKSRRKKTKKPEDTPPVDDDIIEDALLQLQVTHNCLIYHTASAGETAEWIKNFSEHISTVPYRHVQMTEHDGAAFCMETGQVKTGEDKLDTFVKMLQEVTRVTAPMAYGIITKYPSVADLVKGMKRHGPTMLEDVRKSANKNGTLTDSRIGPAVSKRLYKVFMGLDEGSADV